MDIIAWSLPIFSLASHTLQSHKKEGLVNACTASCNCNRILSHPCNQNHYMWSLRDRMCTSTTIRSLHDVSCNYWIPCKQLTVCKFARPLADMWARSDSISMQYFTWFFQAWVTGKIEISIIIFNDLRITFTFNRNSFSTEGIASTPAKDLMQALCRVACCGVLQNEYHIIILIYTEKYIKNKPEKVSPLDRTNKAQERFYC